MGFSYSKARNISQLDDYPREYVQALVRYVGGYPPTAYLFSKLPESMPYSAKRRIVNWLEGNLQKGWYDQALADLGYQRVKVELQFVTVEPLP
jgi:hypothetical protein